MANMRYQAWLIIVSSYAGVTLWSGLLSGACIAAPPPTHMALWNISQGEGGCGLPCSEQPGSCTQQLGDKCGDAVGFFPNGSATSTQAVCQYTGPFPESQPSFDNVGRGILFAYVMVTTEVGAFNSIGFIGSMLLLSL
jgi:hypothetical protein